jgi:type II secretion system protein H
MRTLATGKTLLKGNAQLAQYKHDKNSEAGFTLIELLVAICVMAVLLGVAVLSLPNHDERYWRDNLDQLVSSLNFAEEESAMSGTPMLAHVDGLGWRFSMPISSVSVAGGNLGSTFLPEVYRAHQWHKPVEIMPVQLILGGETTTEALQVSIKQESRQALLLRSTSGRFKWVRP